jgi:hypothetical protein
MKEAGKQPVKTARKGWLRQAQSAVSYEDAKA